MISCKVIPSIPLKLMLIVVSLLPAATASGVCVWLKLNACVYAWLRVTVCARAPSIQSIIPCAAQRRVIRFQ